MTGVAFCIRICWLVALWAAAAAILEGFVLERWFRIGIRKPVYHVEYELPVADFCPSPPGFRSIRKPISLPAQVQACPRRDT